jgi:hypothetical protein
MRIRGFMVYPVGAASCRDEVAGMLLSRQPQPTEKQLPGLKPLPFCGRGGGRRKPMNLKMSAVAAAVIFAAAAALLVAAVTLLPLRAVPRTIATNATIFLCLAAYAAFLARSSGRRLRAIFAPLFMLAAVVAAAGSVTGFVVPAAAGVSWIRSGICFQGSMPRRVCAEAITCPAGLALVWLLQPPGPCGWALSIWMFGLIQALYFVAVDTESSGLPELSARERLEKAHGRTEALLREQELERAFEELGLS